MYKPSKSDEILDTIAFWGHVVFGLILVGSSFLFFLLILLD